ncbi:MAG: ParB/RepB/Spo0J family partition protein [Candidatus Sedimenticola sp. (ex Thyasira tokunagai)]
MPVTTLLKSAFDQVGVTKLATACGITPTPMRKWLDRGLPMSDLTGETDYCVRIAMAAANNDVEISAIELLRERLPDMKPGIVYNIPRELIQPDINQPRKQFDPAKLQSLAATLAADGQESAIKVSLDMSQPAPLIITHGERRWRAAEIAELGDLDCMIDERPDETATDKIFRQAADNTAEQLTKWDWACTIQQLHDNEGMTDQKIADELERRGFDGFSRPVIANLRRLFNLPEKAQQLIAEEYLTPSHGKYLLQITHDKTMEDVLVVLIQRNGDDGDAPAISVLQSMIERAYRQNCAGLNTYSYLTHSTQFDHEEECKGCKDQHKYGDDLFCGRSGCWEKKSHTHQSVQTAKEEERQAQIDEGVRKAEAGEPSFLVDDPELQEEVDDEIEWKANQKASEEKREKKAAYKEAIFSALDTADTSLIVTVLIADAVLEDYDEDEMDFAGVLEQVKAGQEAMLRKVAITKLGGWFDYFELEDVGKALGIDPEKVSPETTPEQTDLLAGAA